jgi:hypothetical protein
MSTALGQTAKVEERRHFSTSHHDRFTWVPGLKKREPSQWLEIGNLGRKDIWYCARAAPGGPSLKAKLRGKRRGVKRGRCRRESNFVA